MVSVRVLTSCWMTVSSALRCFLPSTALVLTPMTILLRSRAHLVLAGFEAKCYAHPSRIPRGQGSETSWLFLDRELLAAGDTRL
jgi:hypothetical protein